ncbi:MAG: hypothetical protein ABSB79_10470 [Syntrophales bacterium]|jgi:hypothetical protein
MAKSRYTFNKSTREKARKKKQEEKAARRLENKKMREGMTGEDPNIAVINPDPEALPTGNENI